MKTITEEQITQIFESFSNLKPKQAQDFMEHVMQTQPAVLAYLMTMDPCFEKGTPPKEDEGLLFFAGLAILNILLEQQPERDMISPKEIDRAEDNNTKLLQQLDEDPEKKAEPVFLRMTRTYNQAPLFLFASQLLFEGIDSEDDIDDDIALASLKLKTVIDCFDRPEPAQAADKD